MLKWMETLSKKETRHSLLLATAILCVQSKEICRSDNHSEDLENPMGLSFSQFGDHKPRWLHRNDPCWVIRSYKINMFKQGYNLPDFKMSNPCSTCIKGNVPEDNFCNFDKNSRSGGCVRITETFWLQAVKKQGLAPNYCENRVGFTKDRSAFTVPSYQVWQDRRQIRWKLRIQQGSPQRRKRAFHIMGTKRKETLHWIA